MSDGLVPRRDWRKPAAARAYTGYGMSKSYGHLIPSVERRLSTWVGINEPHATGAPPGSRPAITISRRFGCEAYPLSEQLKTLLEARTGETWNIYDKALLELVSQDENLSMKVLSDLGNPSSSADFIGFLVPGYLRQNETFKHIPKYIIRIAQAGNAIIVGLGGALITRTMENCYHFRLEADLEFRVASIARRMELPEAEARRLVRDNEKTREKFLEDCLGGSLTDAAIYDAVYNNGKHGVVEIAHSIVAYVSEAWKTREAAPQ
jgi:cytidylate kinase